MARVWLAQTLLLNDQTQEAQKLLKSPAADGEPYDRRLQALLLARRGGERNRRKARRLPEKLAASTHESAPGDHLLLARLYEAEGNLQAARDQYLEYLALLANQAQPQPSHVLMYVEMLLRHGQLDAAARWLKKLAVSFRVGRTNRLNETRSPPGRRLPDILFVRCLVI